MSPFQRFVLKLAVFAAGALLMALEVSAFRIIGKTFGSALRETTTVIAVFLAAMSAGYWAGGRVGDRWPRPMTLVATLFTAAAACFCVPALDAWLSPLIAESRLALSVHAFLATSVLFAIPTFLFAATSPIAIRLFTTSTGASGATAGSISAISTSGSIAGSLATAFFLIDWLASINRTVLFVGIGALLVAALTLIASPHALTAGPARLRRRALLAAAAIFMITLTMAFVRTSSIDRSLLAPLPNTLTLFEADSPYHHVTVRQRGPIREIVFDIAVQSRMHVQRPNGSGLPYADTTHLARLMRPQTKRILLLGLGGGTIAKQYASYYDDTTVDAVDVDPLVVEVAQRFFHVKPSARLRTHVADGRIFVKRTKEKWDLIIIDAYSTNRYGDTLPPHLATREFFAELESRLNPGGIVHFHVTFHGSQLLPALQKTLGTVFPHTARVHGELLASSEPLVMDKEVLAARAHATPAVRLPHLAGAIAALHAEPAPPDAPLLTDDYAPVDTLLRRRN